MNERILVIEDDESTLQAITFKLQKEGFKIVTASDSASGFESLSKNGPFKVILLDLMMPKGDGFGFLEKKKNDLKIQNIPVIVFTNMSQKDSFNRAKELGVKGYLIKAHHSVFEIVAEVRKCIAGEVGHFDY